MASVMVRDNEDGTYDVLFLGLDKTDTMAVREGFSALEVNQNWAAQNQANLTAAVRENSILAELHQEYKDTIRDVVAEEEPAVDDNDEYAVVGEEEDSLEDQGFVS